MALTLSGATIAQTPALSPANLPSAQLTEISVPGTTAMGTAAIDLAKYGYTEKEYFAEGTANRYRGTLPSSKATATVLDGGWHYKTRVLVRAPKAGKFNGTLVVEWANVTAGQDVDFAFAESYDHLLREGYAVAILSAQRVGVDRLRTWNPARYNSLSVTADATNPVDGSKLDECGGAPACPGDPLSWDIMTAVSKALKDNAGPNPPLPGMKPEKVIALGESQSAARLTVYYNAIQPIYHFFDGFVFFDLAFALRTDQHVPAISINSESTGILFPITNSADFIRTWAVAGASHSSLYAGKYVDSMFLRDKSAIGPNGPMPFSQILAMQNCDLQPNFSSVNHGLLQNAALDAVNAWARTGKAAPASQVFERDASGALLRDANGQVRGGIRLAQFTAPTADIVPNGKPVFCTLGGHRRDFTAAELKARYRTHRNYVKQVSVAMTRLEQQGYILAHDRDSAIAEARQSDVAR